MSAYIYLENKEPIRIVNEDGTDIDFEYPQTELYEKWDKLYPPTKYGKPCGPVLGTQSNGAPIMNYGCVLCHEEKCRHSSYWKVPEEDKVAWEQYKKAIREYDRVHNPSIANKLDENEKLKESEEIK